MRIHATKTKTNVLQNVTKNSCAYTLVYDLKECGGIRVFKTKFTSLQDGIQRMMESGNKSKYGGELSSIFSNMKVIREERLQMEHQKSLSREEKEASKQKMDKRYLRIRHTE